jgi:hypothetical protein
MLEIIRLGSGFEKKVLHATIIHGIPCDFIKFEIKTQPNGMVYSVDSGPTDIKRSNLRAQVWAEVC